MPRKSKNFTTSDGSTTSALTPTAAPTTQKTKSASGGGGAATKKNFVVVASVGPNGIQGNLMPEIRKPLIAHLQIQSKEILALETNMHYDPQPPPIQAFNANDLDSFVETPALLNEPEETKRDDAYNNHLAPNQGEIKNNDMAPVLSGHQLPHKHQHQSQQNQQQQPQQTAKDFYKKNFTLLVQYKDTAETKLLPEKIDVACFWCCHTFGNRPCIIPYRDLGSHLMVYGNFCSPECAMAYLFEQRIDAHTRWEQLSLLNRVYSDSVDGGRISVAPSRLSLKIFGGPFTIEEFRSILQSHKYRVDIHPPPMISILSTMDTKPIDFYDASITKTLLETAQERVAKAEEVLRLKRSKPLKAWENTLDACMNIRVGTATVSA